MANLTIVVDDQVLLQARMRALQQGTSVNAVLRRSLEDYAGGDEKYRQTTARLLELAQASTASSQGRCCRRAPEVNAFFLAIPDD